MMSWVINMAPKGILCNIDLAKVCQFHLLVSYFMYYDYVQNGKYLVDSQSQYDVACKLEGPLT